MDLKVLLAAASLVAVPAVASADTTSNSLPIISHQIVTYPAGTPRQVGYPFENDGNGLPQGIPHNGSDQRTVVYAWESDANGLPTGETQSDSKLPVVYPFQNGPSGIPTGN